MLWFGLRRRFGGLARRVRAIEELTASLREDVSSLRQLRATMSEGIAAVENATDKLNRVVERRRKQMAYTDEEECEHGVSLDEECEDCELADLIASRRGPPTTGGTDGAGGSSAGPPVSGV